MQFLIQKARIKKTSFINGKNYTVILVPAKDEFSQPTSFRVASDKALGNVGSDVALKVSVSGFVSEKHYKDKDTGQDKIFDDAKVFFDAEIYQGKAA